MNISTDVQPGQVIYMDNFFTSVKLFSDLHATLEPVELFDQIGFGNPPQLANFKKGTTKRVLQELSPMCMYQKDAHLLAVG